MKESTEELSHIGFAGVPLSVVFAEGDSIREVCSAGRGTLRLEPPFHVSEHDAYFVVPDDIGMELIDILRDGDLDLLRESLRDGILAQGTLSRESPGKLALEIERCVSPLAALNGLPYADTVTIGPEADPLVQLNSLPQVQCTLVSALFDENGLDRVLDADEYVGVSWSGPSGPKAPKVDPTFVWSRRLSDHQIGVELALFLEYEELVTCLRPVVLRVPTLTNAA